MLKKTSFVISLLFSISMQSFCYASSSDEAIMVVRYNNNDIDYLHSLSMLAKKSIQSNPDADYEVIGVISANTDQNYISDQIDQFVEALKGNNITQAKITTKIETDQDVKVPEIRLLMKNPSK